MTGTRQELVAIMKVADAVQQVVHAMGAALYGLNDSLVALRAALADPALAGLLQSAEPPPAGEPPP